MAGGRQRPASLAQGGGIDRRTFIAGASAAGGAVVVDVALASTKTPSHLVAGLKPAIQPIRERVAPAVTVYLRRRDDFLFLQVDGYNVVIKGQRLFRTGRGTPTIVVTHLPQHLTEQAFLDPAKPPKWPGPTTPGKSDALLAYPSRLAFTFPSGVNFIPLTLASLLDWSQLDPSLTPVGRVEESVRAQDVPRSNGRHGRPRVLRGSPPSLRAPKATETAIELPWHLVISPTSSGKWSHPVGVIERAGWTELWRTRLAARAAVAAADGGSIRAVWNYDTLSNGKPTLSKGTIPSDSHDPFLTSLSSSDRYEIVRATSDFSVGGRADIPASKLWLSARSGFLDSDGHWKLSNHSGLDLEQWRHLATVGRDHYVKVVKRGYLFPFGHRVTKTTITEREFQAVGSENVATLRQITYLTIRQPVKNYADPSDTFALADGGRRFPFRVLEIKTLRTPDLSPSPTGTKTSPYSGYGGKSLDAFVPYVGTGPSYSPFLFHLVGTDWNGNQAPFVVPAVFVPSGEAFDPAQAKAVRIAYNKPQTPDIRVGQFTGRQIAFAESKTAGDTNLEVHTITFEANPGAGGTQTQYEDADQPICYPELQQAQVRLSAAEQASGSSLGMPTVSYNDAFVEHSFNSPQNVGNLFLEITGAPKLNFSGGSAGGVMTPNLALTGISRALGPVAGSLGNILDGTFDPESVFQDVQAKILGGVNLMDLLAKVLLTPDAGAPGRGPDAEGDDPDTLYDDGALKITYDVSGTTVTTEVYWTPPLKPIRSSAPTPTPAARTRSPSTARSPPI